MLSQVFLILFYEIMDFHGCFKVIPGNGTLECAPSPTLLKGVMVTLWFIPHTMSIITLVSSFMSPGLFQPVDSVPVPLLIDSIVPIQNILGV